MGPVSLQLRDAELDSVTRDVATKTGAHIALFGVWDADLETVAVISTWGVPPDRDNQTTRLPADSFVGSVLQSGQALVESVDSEQASSLSNASMPSPITYVAGVPVRKPGGPSAALCLGFASAPADRDLTRWLLRSYGRIASMHLTGRDDAASARPRLKLMIVDDHEIVREGLNSALAGDERFEIIGSAGNAQEAFQLARRKLPDVTILDMYLPDASGDELCVRLRALLPSLTVIIVSSYLTEEAVRRAATAGAAAYVTKAAGLPELRAALDRTWADRGRPIDESNVPKIVKYLETLVKDRSGDDRGPTPQQARVLELAAEGLTYDEIAERLMISQSTVRFHMQKLKVKFGTSSKTDLIVKCIRLGLIVLPSNEAGVSGS